VNGGEGNADPGFPQRPNDLLRDDGALRRVLRGGDGGLKDDRDACGARIAVALLPFPFFVAFLVAEIRLLRRVDELERKIQLEALAVAFPAAMLLMMALGLLERAVALKPEDWSYRHTWFFLPLFYFVGLGIARRRYR
jgi:hypothetical protein